MTDSERAYIREYIRHWKRQRRRAAIKRLGGCCAQCGSRRRLEFDHIHREEKTIKSNHLLTARKEDFDRELTKIQLLCHRCHTLKTALENTQ